jgi:hypothetical protein
MFLLCNEFKLIFLDFRSDIPAENKGDLLSKRYTPIPYANSPPEVMNLLVKVYKPNENFPKGGRVSQYLDRIQIGESISMKYPYGKAIYLGDGQFLFK